jgi:ubiquinone/menaquinone biosynthesis C-methylase UbiE
MKRGSHANLDVDSRRRKAEKLRRLVELERPVAGSAVLEFGTGSGVIASDLARFAGRVVSVDVVDERVEREGYEFLLVEGTQLPLDSDTFDIAISNHVIEHVGDREAQIEHLREAARVLKPDGLLYIACPSRWALIEPHFHLPLLSWLPAKARSGYVRVTGRGRWYDCNPPTRRTLSRALQAAGLDPTDRTLDATKLFALEGSSVARLAAALPAAALRALAPLSPTIVFTARDVTRTPRS